MRKLRREHTTSAKTAGIGLLVIVLSCVVLVVALAAVTAAVKLAIG